MILWQDAKDSKVRGIGLKIDEKKEKIQKNRTWMNYYQRSMKDFSATSVNFKKSWFLVIIEIVILKAKKEYWKIKCRWKLANSMGF